MPPSDTTINIHEAKTHLSRLIERVCAGETVVIAKAGKPLVRMVAVDAPPAPNDIAPSAGNFPPEDSTCF